MKKTVGEKKAAITDEVARQITARETANHDEKKERLKEARLAKEAEASSEAESKKHDG